MSDLDKTMRKALLSTSDVIHDPGAAIAEITRLTELNAELEAECERLNGMDRPQYSVCNDHPHITAVHRMATYECPACRADTLQAQLDAVKGLPVKTAGDIYWEQEHGENCLALYVDIDDLQQALNAPETA